MFPDNLATQDLLDLTAPDCVICNLTKPVMISMYRRIVGRGLNHHILDIAPFHVYF